MSRVTVLQCVAVCCSVLQCVAVCCSMLQCVAVCSSVLQCVGQGSLCHRGLLQKKTVDSKVLQWTSFYYSHASFYYLHVFIIYIFIYIIYTCILCTYIYEHYHCLAAGMGSSKVLRARSEEVFITLHAPLKSSATCIYCILFVLFGGLYDLRAWGFVCVCVCVCSCVHVCACMSEYVCVCAYLLLRCHNAPCTDL